MKWTNSCDALVDFVEEHGGSMGGETRDHLFNIVQNIVDGQSVLETPPPDWNQPFPDECKHYNLPENCHWCKEELEAALLSAPVPADPQRIAETPERRIERLVAELTKAHADLDEARAELEKLKSAPVPARRVVSQNRLEAEIRLVLQRQYTAAYDLAGDITAILDEYVTEPVPAPRLEWHKIGFLPQWVSKPWTIWTGAAADLESTAYFVGHGPFNVIAERDSLDAAKSLAEKLNDVLSPPVGTQE